MRFNSASGGGWAITPNGDFYFFGAGPVSIDVARERAKAYTEAVEAYDRQVEAAKPKPGEFEPGDIVTWYQSDGYSNSAKFSYQVKDGRDYLVNVKNYTISLLVNKPSFIKVED